MDIKTENSKTLLDKMRVGCKYTYRELLTICGFKIGRASCRERV